MHVLLMDPDPHANLTLAFLFDLCLGTLRMAKITKSLTDREQMNIPLHNPDTPHSLTSFLIISTATLQLPE